jgi:dienelactone hydrolase
MPNSNLEADKNVLIASDIFGLSEGFKSLLQEIVSVETSIAISPYEASFNSFETEQQAYTSFQASGGIDTYAKKLTNIIQANNNLEHLIGFSAGAAALYTVMSLNSRNDIKLTLFYPGQIRYFLDEAPNCPCRIIFPEQETHFPLTKVINSLKQHPQVQIEHTSYQHGFMNKDSVSFNKSAYTYYCTSLKGLPSTDDFLKL